MSKKKIDIQGILVYLAMALLLLIILLPPILRSLVPKEGSNSVEEAPKIVALICKKQVIVNQLQYNVSVNSTYQKNILNKVTFTYRSTPATEVVPTEEREEEKLTTQGSATPSVTEDFVQSEVKALKAIPGMAVEEEENFTKMILSKTVVDTFDTNSPYRSYFQPIEKQQAYFQSQGYSCQTVKN